MMLMMKKQSKGEILRYWERLSVLWNQSVWQEQEEEEEEERESTSWWEVARAALPYTQCNAIFRLLCRTPASIVDAQYTMVQITRPTYTPDIFLFSHLLNVQTDLPRLSEWSVCWGPRYLHSCPAPPEKARVRIRLGSMKKQGLE